MRVSKGLNGKPPSWSRRRGNDGVTDRTFGERLPCWAWQYNVAGRLAILERCLFEPCLFEPCLLILWFEFRIEFASETSTRKSYELVSS